tara:strand:- start:473 stop:607 length:135 start_codon:yes stop_codon:yes gene_type:complete
MVVVLVDGEIIGRHKLVDQVVVELHGKHQDQIQDLQLVQLHQLE